MAITLRALFDRLPQLVAQSLTPEADSSAIEISSIAEDSRRVEPGTLFVAHLGRGTDGHRYIGAALERGAVAVVGERPLSELQASLPAGTPYWQASDARLAFAQLSAAFYDFPSRKFIVVGVTGTDGKTTTSTLAQSVLSAHGMKTGLITTIAARIGSEEIDTGFHVTTPEAFDLQGYLAHMAAEGCAAAVVETTSHGLDQARVAEIEYDVASVTNVTHEHLDWHGSWENYMQAKARLFHMLTTSARKPGVSKVAVLNRDDQSYPILSAIATERQLTYSLTSEQAGAADLSARDIAITREGTRFTLRTPEGEAAVQLRLLGAYNVANALAAAGIGLALNIPLAEIVAGLEAAERVRGRMEWAYQGDFDVMVDFAHTPNALRETISLARKLVRPQGRVVPIFGSAGLRDVEKRELMGRVASAADFVVVTAEDPRTEDVHDIMAEIAAGLIAEGRTEGADFIRVADRAEAIAEAVRLAQPGDLLVACGKAHEQSMCYGTTETPWDEFAAIEQALRQRGLQS